jgi:ethanolamine utilization protein EutM
MALFALGLIETLGYTAAVSAADAALKAASVELVGVERVIGVNGSLGVTIQLSGDVGAVRSAVEAGKLEAEKVGKVVSTHVIARSHQEVNDKILPLFSLNQKAEKSREIGSEEFSPQEMTASEKDFEKKKTGKQAAKKEAISETKSTNTISDVTKIEPEAKDAADSKDVPDAKGESGSKPDK